MASDAGNPKGLRLRSAEANGKIRTSCLDCCDVFFFLRNYKPETQACGVFFVTPGSTHVALLSHVANKQGSNDLFLNACIIFFNVRRS